jgi:hypothetical protein
LSFVLHSILSIRLAASGCHFSIRISEKIKINEGKHILCATYGDPQSGSDIYAALITDETATCNILVG